VSETLEVLIKLAERKVEAAQLQLNRTRGRIRFVQDEQVRLEREAAVAFVQAVAEDDVLALQLAGAFQERMRKEVFKLKEEEAALHVREGEEQVALQKCFAEQKRFELLLEKQKLAKKKERAKKAQNQLDDIGQRKR